MELEGLHPEKMQEFFLDDLLDEMTVHEALDLLLLVIDEKPAATVTVYFQNLSQGFRNLVEKFSIEFDLVYVTREVQGEKEKAENVTGSTVFFTRSQERLEELKPLKDATTEDIGRFLGYPEKAVEEFETSKGFQQTYSRFKEMMENDSVSEEDALDFLEENTSERSYTERFEEKVREMVESGEISEEDEKYLQLVSYIPRLGEEDVIEAVEEGKRREKLLQEMDEGLGITVGEKYREKIL